MKNAISMKNIEFKKMYKKISEILKDNEKLILELRFGLNDNEPKTQNEIANILRNITFLRFTNRI